MKSWTLNLLKGILFRSFISQMRKLRPRKIKPIFQEHRIKNPGLNNNSRSEISPWPTAFFPHSENASHPPTPPRVPGTAGFCWTQTSMPWQFTWIKLHNSLCIQAGMSSVAALERATSCLLKKGNKTKNENLPHNCTDFHQYLVRNFSPVCLPTKLCFPTKLKAAPLSLFATLGLSIWALFLPPNQTMSHTLWKQWPGILYVVTEQGPVGLLGTQAFMCLPFLVFRE